MRCISRRDIIQRLGSLVCAARATHDGEGPRGNSWGRTSTPNRGVNQPHMAGRAQQHQQQWRCNNEQGPTTGTEGPLTNDEKLIRRFGPHAKLVIREHQPKTYSTADAPPPATTFKASVTFKQLGFPVEIAAVEAPTFEAAEQLAMDVAMDSNVVFLRPMNATNQQQRVQHVSQFPAHLVELKRTVDDLRSRCQVLGRVLKFSVKPVKQKPAMEGDSPSDQRQHQQQQYGCRAYVRDDWAVSATLSFLHEARSFSPNDALTRCFTALQAKYREEMDSPAFVKGDFLEVERMLQLRGKTVTTVELTNDADSDSTNRMGNSNDEEDKKLTSHYLSQSKHAEVFSVAATIEDSNGNMYTVRSLQQSTLQEAYRGIALQIVDAEAQWQQSLVERASAMPMLLKLRWQAEGMAHHIAEMNQRPRGIDDVIEVSIIETVPPAVDALQQQSDSYARQALRYIGTASLEGQVVASSEGLGPYRVEFNIYVQLLSSLLDRYPEVAQFHFHHCYPSIELLERASSHHDNYRLFNHQGKWNCYSVLGSITSTIIGNYYEKEFRACDAMGTLIEASITVNDGMSSKKLLTKRIAHRRGQAWRDSTLDCIKHNFPVQYRIACQHEGFDNSAEDFSSRGSKFKALPREKRVQHINQLYGIIAAFAEEDYGWTSLRIRTRTVAGDNNRWVAELEGQVEGEKSRRIVAVSPIAQSSKVARRMLVFNVCRQYFPKDLANYSKLGRADSADPEAMETQITHVYRPNMSLFAQVLSLLEANSPDLGPFSWRLERYYDPTTVDSRHKDNDGSIEDMMRPMNARFKATVFGNGGEVIVAERIGDEGEGAIAVVRSLLKATCDAYVRNTTDGVQLWQEYNSAPPPPLLSSAVDLCYYVFQQALGGAGGGNGTSAEASATSSTIITATPAIEVECAMVSNEWWVANLVMPNMGYLPIAKAAARTKKDATKGVMILAARASFARQIRHYSKNFIEAHTYADEVFHAAVLTAPPCDAAGEGKTLRSQQKVATPHQFLIHLTETKDPSCFVWHEQFPNVGGGGYSCRVYRQRKPSAPAAAQRPIKAEAMEVGYGSGLTKQQALQSASLSALEALFESDLRDKCQQDPTFASSPLFVVSDSV